MVDVEVAPVGGGAASLRGELGLEPHHRRLDQPVGLERPDAVGEPRDLPVDGVRRLARQAEGRPRDAPPAPRREPALHHALPHAGEAVPHLQPLADQGVAGAGRHAQRGRELGHGVRRHGQALPRPRGGPPRRSGRRPRRRRPASPAGGGRPRCTPPGGPEPRPRRPQPGEHAPRPARRPARRPVRSAYQWRWSCGSR